MLVTFSRFRWPISDMGEKLKKNPRFCDQNFTYYHKMHQHIIVNNVSGLETRVNIVARAWWSRGWSTVDELSLKYVVKVIAVEFLTRSSYISYVTYDSDVDINILLVKCDVGCDVASDVEYLSYSTDQTISSLGRSVGPWAKCLSSINYGP